jgi:hypothetical protein
LIGWLSLRFLLLAADIANNRRSIRGTRGCVGDQGASGMNWAALPPFVRAERWFESGGAYFHAAPQCGNSSAVAGLGLHCARPMGRLAMNWPWLMR